MGRDTAWVWITPKGPLLIFGSSQGIGVMVAVRVRIRVRGKDMPTGMKCGGRASANRWARVLELAAAADLWFQFRFRLGLGLGLGLGSGLGLGLDLGLGLSIGSS